MNLPIPVPSSSQSANNWLDTVLSLLKTMTQYVKPKTPTGLYEILEYETELEILNAKGSAARLKKRLKVRFLQDNVIAFEDYAWGDGEVLHGYRCVPGKVVDYYREGERWNVLISLRETKSRGDVTEFYIERHLKHSFENREAWWQASMSHETRRLRVTIIFPKARRCLRATLAERNRNRVTVIGESQLVDLPDGRQVLTYESTHIRRFETYTIKWVW